MTSSFTHTHHGTGKNDQEARVRGYLKQMTLASKDSMIKGHMAQSKSKPKHGHDHGPHVKCKKMGINRSGDSDGSSSASSSSCRSHTGSDTDS